MDVVRSRAGVPIRPTEERWRPIAAGHRELGDQRERVVETVPDPEPIQDGDGGEVLAIRLSERTPVTRTYLVVAYRESGGTDGFVPTTYVTRRPSARRTTRWTR